MRAMSFSPLRWMAIFCPVSALSLSLTRCSTSPPWVARIGNAKSRRHSVKPGDERKVDLLLGNRRFNRAHVRTPEEDLGGFLLERNTRSVRLTETGWFFC